MAITTREDAELKFQTKYPEWKLTHFTTGLGECVVTHICGTEKTYSSFNSVLCLGPFCESCKPEKEIKWKYSIGENIKDDKRDITIVDRKIVYITENGKRVRKKYYKHKCNICGYDGGENYVDGELLQDRWTIESSLGAGVGCAICGHKAVAIGVNDVATLFPQRVQFFKNKSDTLIYSPKSHSIVDVVCPLCGREKRKRVDSINDMGIGCVCGDGFSYPEKFFYNILEQLKLPFVFQLTNADFEWCGNKRYDFYLINQDIIVEVHGKQHYTDDGFHNNRTRTFEEEVENDKLKQELAFNNGFDENTYIVLDCRKSELEYIKKSIEDSGLLNVINIHNATIDWQQRHTFAISNFIKKMCDFWERYRTKDQQIIETKMIADHFHISSSGVLRGLKQGREFGWCQFVTRLEWSQITDNEVVKLYSLGMSINQIMEQLNVNRHKVIDALKKGTKQGLCYYDGKQSLIESNLGINSPVGQPVHCVELNLMFPTATDGAKFIGHNLSYALRYPDKKCGGYHWERVTKEQYEEWISNQPTIQN